MMVEIDGMLENTRFRGNLVPPPVNNAVLSEDLERRTVSTRFFAPNDARYFTCT